MTKATPSIQDLLLQLLGTEVDSRGTLIRGMLRRDSVEATSYWLQLIVSMGIATLGLVVGSAAVVIGAMLVAPLMGPIVGLAMGLACGSPVLVLRAAVRISTSVLVVVSGAALISLLLPFHEVNSEILARTSPTILDLLTASFCAIAGVYATLNAGSETSTTAAGTSISISLVPPLCASGYGIGSRLDTVATGAGLLFLTNLVAIVVVGTCSFILLGFHRVEIAQLERDELKEHSSTNSFLRALVWRLSLLFDSRPGTVLRLAMPFLLLGIVYFPLRRAFDEVVWQVRVRAALTSVLNGLQKQIVQSRTRVERHEIEVKLVIIGSTKEAQTVRTTLENSMREVSGVEPRTEVVAVPDATAFAGLQNSILNPTVVPPVLPPTFGDHMAAVGNTVQTALTKLWPSGVVGAPLSIEVGIEDSGPLRIHVTHIGNSIGDDTRETLQKSLVPEVNRPVVIVDNAVPATELTRSSGDGIFLKHLSLALYATRGLAPVSVCVVRPSDSHAVPSKTPIEKQFTQLVDELLLQHPKVTVLRTGAWSVRFVHGDCLQNVQELFDNGPAK